MMMAGPIRNTSDEMDFLCSAFVTNYANHAMVLTKAIPISVG